MVLPSPMTAKTAWYRCSATLICLMKATVTNQPQSLGHISRRCVTHQPKPFRDASTDLAHKSGAGGRIRTDGQLFTKQLLYH
jgi:hypothetical protein